MYIFTKIDTTYNILSSWMFIDGNRMMYLDVFIIIKYIYIYIL